MNLVRYHLGSVCLGSMLISLVKVIKLIIKALRRKASEESSSAIIKMLLGCFEWLFDKLEKFLKYLIRNAYIIVAKDGTPLYDSGKKAFNLIFHNLQDVFLLNFLGDFTLFLGKVFVTAITTFIGYYMMVSQLIMNY